jgi:NTP pyrophosphatase (non-canonical NTP hydrolase)
MTFDEYQAEARKTLIVSSEDWHVYTALGLAGEAGEVADLTKKFIRDDEWNVSDERREDIKKELGDVLWYLAMVADAWDISLEHIAFMNISKLRDRMERGVIKGSGNNR